MTRKSKSFAFIKVFSSFIWCIALLLVTTKSWAVTEAALNDAFAKYKKNVPALRILVKNMPKGADLHNHMAGAMYAEDYLALGNQFCLNNKTLELLNSPACVGSNITFLNNISMQQEILDKIIENWSLWSFIPSSGNTRAEHFFTTFEYFGKLSDIYRAQLLLAIMNRAALEHEIYLELMLSFDGQIDKLVKKLKFQDNNFSAMYKQLLDLNIAKHAEYILAARSNLDEQFQHIAHCAELNKAPACNLERRYIQHIYRNNPPESVFTQLMVAFMAASQDKQIVAINLVEPEYYYYSLHDYTTHMQMIGFFKKLYPEVHVSLHAGELTLGLVTPENLHDHIEQAVLIAHTERVGHGVDISYETNATETLAYMAKHHIAVEINLSSNEIILDVAKQNHPINLYLNHNVPIVISTDDAGVERSDLTNEYLKAVIDQNLSYSDLKKAARNSIRYAFLPGADLWEGEYVNYVDTCQKDAKLSDACQLFLDHNPKAKLQLQLEQQFLEFETDSANLLY
jgi:adenosine deaminase